MISALTEWVKSIVFVVLFASFLELLLPSSSMQKFVRAVLGLFIMMTILNPVVELLSNNPGEGQIEFTGGNFETLEPAPEAKAVDSFGLKRKQEQLAREHYIKELSKQIRATALSIEGITEAKVAISLKNLTEISGQLSGGSDTKEASRTFIPQIDQVIIFAVAKSSSFEEQKKETRKETKIDKIIIGQPNSAEPEYAFLKPHVKEKIKRAVSELYHIHPEKIEVKEMQ